MSREFKQCPNGHYYRGDNCPYCQSQQDEPNITYVTVKACPNRHAYDKYKQECPVCGSKEVIKVYECRNTSYFHVDFIVPEVMVNEKSIYRVRAVRMLVSDGNIYNYVFVDHMGKEHSFESGDDILVGTTRLKGREIMRVCDMALDNKLSILVQNVKLSNMSKYVQCPNGHYYDSEEYDNCPYCKSAFSDNYALEYGHNVFNNPTISDDGKPVFSVKVCPNGHGYDANQMACPFCGSDIVSEVIEERCGFTLVIADLSYERDGISTLCKHAEVDGDMLSGDLCMRIEYTGSFKYAYYVSQKDVYGGLIVNPQSHIVLSGDGFSDTYTGREFYKMCDVLFDQNEKK